MFFKCPFTKYFQMKSIIFLLLCMICQITLCASEKSMSSVLKVNPIPRVFIRKKRFIVFPNYASMKITVAMGKSVIVKYPRGVNLSIEVSVYYPLPTILEEWYPKKYRSSTTPKPMKMRKKPSKDSMQMNPMGAMNISHVVENHPIHSESGTIWLEGNIWNSSIPFAHDASPPKIKNRIWTGNENYHKKYSQSNSWQFNSKPNEWAHSHWQKQPIDWSWRQRQPYWKKYEYSPPKKYYDKSEWEHYVPFTGSYSSWKNYRAHRERRHIFDHFAEFGTIFGVDMNACILKAICESKKYLLPRGYSLIQDVLRIMFSFPTLDGRLDEFSMAASESDCDTSKHIKKCPFSILDMALNPDTVQKL